MKTKIREGGRIVIPSAYRKALGLKPGDEVLLSLEDKEIRIISTHQAISERKPWSDATYRKGSLSEELIKDRREEAAHA